MALKTKICLNSVETAIYDSKIKKISQRLEAPRHRLPSMKGLSQTRCQDSVTWGGGHKNFIFLG